MAPTALSRSKTPTKIPQLTVVQGAQAGPGGSRARRERGAPRLEKITVRLAGNSWMWSVSCAGSRSRSLETSRLSWQTGS